MYRLATKCTTKKRVEETRVGISLYRLVTVEPRDLISSSLVTLVTLVAIRSDAI